ncbi:MAG: galactokinase [Actinomyces sp.]|nr:galactokinase [Propionibacterium sp.]MDN6565551.1 galactokinase [Actinomyces sp.]
MTTASAQYRDAWSGEYGRDRVSTLMQEILGSAPQGVWSAPGRANLIGEHTDYNGGLALPIALPHRAFAALRVRQDRVLRLSSGQQRDVIEINLDTPRPADGPDPVQGWAAYVAGVFWALEGRGFGPLPGMDVFVDSAVPLGSGLSSSAALECCVAVGIDEVAHLGLGGDEAGRIVLQKAAIEAENRYAGANTGGMDQAASLRARAGHALLLDCRTQAIRQIPFDLARDGLELLVINTRAKHSNNDGQYAQRRADCEEAARILGVDLLVEVAPGDLDDSLARLPEGRLRHRVRHVVTEIDRTRRVAALLEGDSLTHQTFEKVGELFNASHDSLREDYEVSCPELDVAVDTARSLGALGARMTGGGFGGSAIALVGVDRVQEVAEGIALAFEEHGFRSPEFLVALPSGPASRA